MAKDVHKIYVLFLIGAGLLSTVVLGIHGAGFYATPLEERPFHPQYESLKPTGVVGQGYGVVGSLMITVGVIMYSSRKRWRAMANMGRIKNWLEFHIFLCLLGPILVLFHTTFKFGGLVAVSFWSMTAVVLSGVVGRYFYVQIPKGIQGNELSSQELNVENEKIAEDLRRQFGLDANLLKLIDSAALPGRPVAEMGLMEVLSFFIVSDFTRRSRLHALFANLERRGLRGHMLARIRAMATRRIILTRRIAFLQQFKKLFHYWHVVHLPFSIVMFVILSIHVGVAIAFGYTWIF
ncbi:MAG TPA: hypothetical protein VMM80_05265 [Bacteroidota bacterium]|nr:hypothetical protein [Bacteroidota bacterium]